ncbi:MAG: ABC transporter permease [Deltaproteobacteria bacterium]|nr:ABC transporter permease [Deltaproteobacteria bacterium]
MGNLFPPFTKVLVETGRLILSGIMGDHILWSLMRVICGFLIGIVFGISTGFMMGYKDLIDRSLHPIIAFLYPIPALGWVPLLMVWLGIGEALPISVIAIHSFFPTCYNTRSGIKNIDQRMVKVARSMGAKGLTLATKVIIPLALPSIFSGLRLSSGGAFRVVIAAEMVAMPKGIGALLMRAESLIRVDIIVSCLFILSLMSVLFERIFLMLERKVLKNEKLSPDRSF